MNDMGIETSSEAATNLPENSSKASAIIEEARPVLDFSMNPSWLAIREPPFKPSIQIALSPGPIRYDHERRAVVLVPYELLDSATRATMDRFAAIGTLGLSVVW